MKECIFCNIIEGKIPSKTIYEDELVKVIMNINPATDGHTLIITKKHIENIMSLNNKTFAHMQKIIKRLYPILKETLHCEGLTICENNELGQEIKHFHFHLIPRYPNDGGEFMYENKNLREIDEVYQEIMSKNIER